MHLVTNATSSIEFFYKISNSLYEKGEKYKDIIELLNTYSEITNFTNNEWDKTAKKIFLNIFGDRQLVFSKFVTFIKPIKEKDLLTDEEIYKFKKLSSNLKRDSYFGRLIGECGGATRNQFLQIIKRLKQGKNTKCCQSVVFRETDIFNIMSQPCLISINCTPRNGKLIITANFRSMGISKAGYGDALGLVEMGQFLAKESNLILDKVCLFAHSSHLRHKDGELKRIKEFLNEIKKIS